MKKRHECRYCKRTFYASPESAAENPWCRACLQERLIVGAIVSWLRGGAGESRARGSVVWEESVMPIYRDLADTIERGGWKPHRVRALTQPAPTEKERMKT